MKLIIAIVSNDDANKVQSELTKNGFSITKLATTGGFPDERQHHTVCRYSGRKGRQGLSIIGEFSKKRTQMVPSTASYGVGMYTSFPVEVTVGGATIFVLDVERFEKL